MREIDESEKKFIDGCRAKKGKVNILENSVECEIDGIILIKKKDKSDILREK